MRVGIALPSVTPRPDPRSMSFTEVRDWAQRAEQAGFDSIWVPDHFFVDMGTRRRGTLDCWTLLTGLACATSRVTFGPLVLCNAFRNPGLLAKAAATLNHLSAGRFVLGMGAGWHEPEYQSLGLPFDHRVSRLEESLRVLRPLLRNEKTTFEGRFIQIRDAELIPPLIADPVTPIWVAGTGPRMLSLTAELAEGWNTAWHGRRTERFKRQADQVREAAQAAGRPAPTLTASVMVIPGSDNEQVIGGSPDEIEAIFREYAEAGAEELIITFSQAPFAIDEAKYFDDFVNDVLPRVQKI